MFKKINLDKYIVANALTAIGGVTMFVSTKTGSVVGVYAGGCICSVALGITIGDIIDYFEDES